MDHHDLLQKERGVNNSNPPYSGPPQFVNEHREELTGPCTHKDPTVEAEEEEEEEEEEIMETKVLLDATSRYLLSSPLLPSSHSLRKCFTSLTLISDLISFVPSFSLSLFLTSIL